MDISLIGLGIGVLDQFVQILVILISDLVVKVISHSVHNMFSAEEAFRTDTGHVDKFFHLHVSHYNYCSELYT